MKQNMNAFSRSRHIAALILTAMALPFEESAAAFASIPEYKSRGHGGKHRPQGRWLGHYANRSKYQPHQGKQECARRVKQEMKWMEKGFQ